MWERGVRVEQARPVWECGVRMERGIRDGDEIALSVWSTMLRGMWSPQDMHAMDSAACDLGMPIDSPQDVPRISMGSEDSSVYILNISQGGWG